MSGVTPWGSGPLQVWINGTDVVGGSAVSVTNFPATQPVSGTFWQTTQPISGTISVSNFPSGFLSQVTNFPANQAVTGTFWQTTQPISAAALPLPSGASTEATLALIKAKTDNLDVPLSTRAVTGLTDTQLRASAVNVSCSGAVAVSGSVAVTGTFFQATQPVSAASLPLPTGASTEATLSTLNGKVTAVNTGAVVVSSSALPAGAATDASVVALTKPSTLCVTATAAVNTAVTLTLPAVAAQFHYITNIQIVKLYAVVGVASGAGVIVTTTNIPGSLAFTTEQLASAAGTVAKVVDMNFGGNPLKSSVVNTATTIICPLQLQTIWRVVVTYYAGT